ncbi:MAG: S8 family serine peptidase [Oligoflexia bacterium]|nr:S8 family serine peptidase [Oligoflexia bacterium]
MKKLHREWFAGLVGGLILFSGPAYGETTELLVRYYEPQNTESQALKSAFFSGGDQALSLGLINSEEGLVKLSFDNAEEAEAAREKLLASGQVQSVTENNYYRPALYLHAVAPETAPSAIGGGLFPFPFPFPWTGGGSTAKPVSYPDVLNPPAVTPGRDPLASKDWALKNINLPKLSAMKFGNKELISAVIDTGVDYNHEDLSGAMWRKPGTKDEVGYDFAHNIAKPYDLRHFDIEGCLKDPGCKAGRGAGNFLTNPGHGTHVAGHMGALVNNSLGIYGLAAPVNTRLMALKFFYDAGERKAGQGDDAAAIKSIDYAIKNGAKVINASWGGRMSPSRAESSELKKALIRAQKAGVLIVIAAGNDAIDNDTDAEPGFPASYTLDNTIVVAATDPSDALGDFSNYGAKKVHIGAPGVKILSTTTGSQYSDIVAKFKDSKGEERVMAWDGTSMAAPIVAGAAALIWSKYPDEDYRQIRARILNTARKVPALAGKVSTGGVLDVSAALSAATPSL